VKGEQCYEHVQWVRQEGLRTQPHLYGSLKNTSSDEKIQLFLRKHIYANCPDPCREAVLGKKRTEMFIGRADQQPVRVLVQSNSFLVTIPALAATAAALLVILAAVAIFIRNHSRPQHDHTILMEAAPSLSNPEMQIKSGDV